MSIFAWSTLSTLCINGSGFTSTSILFRLWLWSHCRNYVWGLLLFRSTVSTMINHSRWVKWQIIACLEQRSILSLIRAKKSFEFVRSKILILAQTRVLRLSLMCRFRGVWHPFKLFVVFIDRQCCLQPFQPTHFRNVELELHLELWSKI